METPKPDSIWQHHSGNRYRVLFVANDVPEPKPKYPPMVVYQGLINGKRWVGELSDWHRRMTPVPYDSGYNERAISEGYSSMISWIREYRYRTHAFLKDARDAYINGEPMPPKEPTP